VGKVDMARLGFVRAEPAETGRPGYDPRDLLKLYLYGYLQQVRSSRRLEAECRRNVELMWLLGRLMPDYKSIAEFRRMHREHRCDPERRISHPVPAGEAGGPRRVLRKN
jgi:transposase